jgi:hypothetical protein
MKRSGYGREEIDEVLGKATFSVPEGVLAPPPPPVTETWDGPAAIDNTISQ